MNPGLGTLTVEGLGSVRGLTLDLTTGVTVLIGANGAGKSNLVSAFELVSRIWDDSFQDYLFQRGGVSNVLFEGPEGPATEMRIRLLADEDAEGNRSGYDVLLKENPADAMGEVVLLERLLFQAPGYPRPYDESLGIWAVTSRARRIASGDAKGRRANFVAHVRPLLEGCRVFHFDDVSDNAPVKGWSTVGDDVELRADAENIAAYLYKVREDYPRHYQRIVSAVRAVTPFFDDFVLEPGRNERIRLRWRQTGLDRTFLAREASDGTLRFICLATLLLGPDRPATVVLDEPELGLHPAAIDMLVEMVRTAAERGHKVILATQSVPLVSHFSVEEIAVLERDDGATVVTRPDAERLSAFLDDYSTGNLWEMNLLGGRPVPETAA